ncbi:hypothetical protein Goshw_024188, partial [Gossypium schwendimanii]|nr:hypothetical protein [Gossypium schwendimanii]
MERGLKNLNIEDGEEEGWMIGDIQKLVYEFYIVGCFLTTSAVHFSAMRNTMTNLWHSLEGGDIDRVENGVSWTFNNHLLTIHQLKEDEDPLQIPLVTANFWVQVHDLPPGLFSEWWQNSLGISLASFYNTIQNNFCLARLNNEGKEMDLGWDLSLQAQSMRVVVVNSIWFEKKKTMDFSGLIWKDN